MKKELSDELRSIAPCLFTAEEGHSFQTFGFEVEDGWFELLKELALKVEPEIASLPEEKRNKVRCLQVKEKLGGLRFYLAGGKNLTPEAAAAFDEAEAKSYVTCQECGKKGRRRSLGGYLCVLCVPCYAGAKRRRSY